MQRIVGLSALLLCASLTTGCGGSSLQAKARRFLHDPQATITRSETVQIYDGTQLTTPVRWTMTLVKGSRILRVPCAEVKPGHACPRSRYALLGFSPTTHALVLYWSISPAQIAAVARAREASPTLRIFPDLVPSPVRCSIPRRGSPGGSVTAACLTEAGPQGHLMRVDFSADPVTNGTFAGSAAEWIVMVGRDGHIQSIHENRTARTYG